MNELDDAPALAGRDPGGMLDQVAGMPAQLVGAIAARTAYATASAGAEPARVRDVLVCGMGGSAIGADLAAMWAERHAVRVAVHRSYGLPSWVGRDTLLVFSSYSGNTEETLSAFAASESLAAPRLAITTGGRLAARARAARVPVWTMPAGLQPRAALGSSLAGLLFLLHGAGIVPDPADEIAVASRSLEALVGELGPLSPERDNPAKRLARRLYGKLPIIHTGPGILSPVGVRWRGQLHENAKTPSFSNVYPELDHNEIMGWQALAEVRRFATLVVLRDRDDLPAVRRRMEVTCEILAPRLAAVEWIDAQGDGVLERMLRTVALGDWTSVYLAFLNDTDPTPVADIELLKSRLASRAPE